MLVMVAHISKKRTVLERSLVLLLFALGQVMPSTCLGDGPLEVVDEDLLQVILGVDGVWLEAL